MIILPLETGGMAKVITAMTIIVMISECLLSARSQAEPLTYCTLSDTLDCLGVPPAKPKKILGISALAVQSQHGGLREVRNPASRLPSQWRT